MTLSGHGGGSHGGGFRSGHQVMSFMGWVTHGKAAGWGMYEFHFGLFILSIYGTYRKRNLTWRNRLEKHHSGEHGDS